VNTLARVRIRPSWGTFPLTNRSIALVQHVETYQIKTIKQPGKNRTVWQKEIPSIEVIKRLDKLRSAKIPAFPISPSVCDGSYIELTIYGELSTVMLGWWTIAPDGADEVADFADWLCNISR